MTTDAVGILHERYIKGDLARQISLNEIRLNAQVARLIRSLRIRAGLTQAELAERVGTTQSAISRVDDPDYGGYSLSMLSRLLAALGWKISIDIRPIGEGT